MTKAAEAMSSAVQWDGQGYMVYQSGALTFATTGASPTAGNTEICPYDGYLVEAGIRNTSAVTTTGTLDFGSLSDDDAFMAAQPVPLTSGYHPIDLTASTVVSRVIPKGTPLSSVLNVATASGSGIHFVAVIGPRANHAS